MSELVLQQSPIAPASLLQALAVESSILPPYRTRSLQQTAAAAGPLLRAAGVTRICNITGLDRLGIPIYSIVRPNSLSFAVSAGKGTTVASAAISAMMEALELFHAEAFEDAQPVDQLDDAISLVDLKRLPLARDRPVEGTDAGLQVSIGRDLISGRMVAVPYDLVHAALRPNWFRRGSGYLVSTNGLASGNSREEAELHGLCEVIERDAFALMLARNPNEPLRNYPYFDLTGIDEPEVQHILERCDRVGITVSAFDITTDVLVPAFYCRMQTQRNDLLPLIADGCGCHPDPNVALRRALTEAVQTRALIISGARDDVRHQEYATLPRPGVTSTRARVAEVVSEFFELTVHEALQWVLQRLRSVGIGQAISVDLCSRSRELAFVRVIVPGLEGTPLSEQYTPGVRARRISGRA